MNFPLLNETKMRNIVKHDILYAFYCNPSNITRWQCREIMRTALASKCEYKIQASTEKLRKNPLFTDQ